MRKTRLFNGEENIEVTEGSTFKLMHQWPARPGVPITFSQTRGIYVNTLVIDNDEDGTLLSVTSIKTDNDFAEISVASEEVEYEVVESEPEPEVLEIPKKVTKRELIEIIELNDFEVDTKQKKADILKDLEEQGKIKIV